IREHGVADGGQERRRRVVVEINAFHERKRLAAECIYCSRREMLRGEVARHATRVRRRTREAAPSLTLRVGAPTRSVSEGEPAVTAPPHPRPLSPGGERGEKRSALLLFVRLNHAPYRAPLRSAAPAGTALVVGFDEVETFSSVSYSFCR